MEKETILNIEDIKEEITLNNIDYYLCYEQDNLYTYRDFETETCILGIETNKNGEFDITNNLIDYNIIGFEDIKQYLEKVFELKKLKGE